MEFTRLAQLTGEDKYYDAVARITTELEAWQSETKVPGLWPKYVDTSGCKKPNVPSPLPNLPIPPEHEQAAIATKEDSAEIQDSNEQTAEGLEEAEKGPPRKSRIEGWRDPVDTGASNIPDVNPGSETEDVRMQGVAKAGSKGNNKASLTKRQLESNAGTEEPASASNPEPAPEPIPTKSAAERVECEPQGLSSPPNAIAEHFTFGGAADSTYEYLPKMHLLLGGNVPQYQKMYESAIDAANKHLLFRPMIPENSREILVVGSANVRENWQDEPSGWQFIPEQSHLLCFTGGMWGIGSKMFSRKQDLEIAKKLTDGCVWSYQATKTGIMPESMDMMPCENIKDCQWNQTHWEYSLDPYRIQREENYKAAKQAALEFEAQRKLQGEQETTPANLHDVTFVDPASKSELPTEGPIAKRDLKDEDETMPTDSRSAEPKEAKSTESSPETAKSKEITAKDTEPKGAKSTESRSEAVESKEITTKDTAPEEEEAKAAVPIKTESKEEISSPPVTSPDITTEKPATLRDDEEPATPPTETPNPYPTHEEFIADRIKREGLPTGVPMIKSRGYILR